MFVYLAYALHRNSRCMVFVMSVIVYTFLKCLLLCLLLQKAGFLYVEQAFAQTDTVFRRRVVLAVGCVMRIHMSMYAYVCTSPHSTYNIVHTHTCTHIIYTNYIYIILISTIYVKLQFSYSIPSAYPLPHPLPHLLLHPSFLIYRNTWTPLAALWDFFSLGLPFQLSTMVMSVFWERARTMCFGSLE